jgi:hypothetical protein
MRRCLLATIFVGLLAFSAALALVAAAPQQERPTADNFNQITALQKERVETLQRLLPLCTASYDAGRLGFESLAAAHDELLKAQLELADKPDQRVALLKAQVQVSQDILKIAEMRVKGGVASQADALQAKAHYLAIKIHLLRELARQTPQTKQK